MLLLSLLFLIIPLLLENELLRKRVLVNENQRASHKITLTIHTFIVKK